MKSRILKFTCASLLMLFGSHVNAVLFAVDDANISMINSNTGTVLNSFPAPYTMQSPEYHALAFSGSSLFYINGLDTPLIAELDASSGTLINSFVTPFDVNFDIEIQLGYGTTSFGSTLFIGNGQTVYLLNPSNGNVFTQWSHSAVSDESGGMDFNTHTGTLFMSDSVQGSNPSFYEYDPVSGAYLGSFSAEIGAGVSYDLKSLAFDEGRLFTASYNNSLIYELDSNNGDLLNTFSSSQFIGGMAGGAYVPIPSAVWLFGSGLIGLISVARRKKA